MYIATSAITNNSTKMIADKTRSIDLDAIHGLLILYMMFMHLLGFAIGTSSKFYYPLTHFLSFFMAWFYFKAGMFYRERSFVDCLKKSSRRLLVPAVAYSLLGFGVYCALNHFRIDVVEELRSFYSSGALHGNNPIWFLFSLFFVQLFYNVLIRIRIKPWLVVILSVIMYILELRSHPDSVMFVNVPLGLFFYSMGVLLSKRQYEPYMWIPSLVLFIALGAIPSVSDFRRGFYDPFFLGLIWSLISCIAINGLFHRFSTLCIKPLRFVGQNAMPYFGTHWLVIMLAQAICVIYELDRSSAIVCYFVVFGFYLAVSTTIIWGMTKYNNRSVSVYEK